MKVIKELTSMIADELEGAEHYVKSAIHYKSEHPGLADVLYEIETEGGITRCLAIFTDFTQTAKRYNFNRL